MKKNATERRRERIKGNKRGERRERKKGREREIRKTKEERTEKEGVQREKRGIRQKKKKKRKKRYDFFIASGFLIKANLAKVFFLLIIATSVRPKIYRPPSSGVGQRFSGECFVDKILFKYKNLRHFIAKDD